MSASDSTDKDIKRQQTYVRWGHAIRDWARRFADGSSILRGKFPAQTDGFYQDVATFLQYQGDRQMDKAWLIRLKTDTSSEIQQKYEAWKLNLEHSAAASAERTSVNTKETQDLLQQINDFVAERVGDSLGKSGPADQRHRAYISERNRLKSAGDISDVSERTPSQFRRDWFLETEPMDMELDSDHEADD